MAAWAAETCRHTSINFSYFLLNFVVSRREYIFTLLYCHTMGWHLLSLFLIFICVTSLNAWVPSVRRGEYLQLCVEFVDKFYWVAHVRGEGSYSITLSLSQMHCFTIISHLQYLTFKVLEEYWTCSADPFVISHPAIWGAVTASSKLRMIVVWSVTPRQSVSSYRCFGGGHFHLLWSL